MLTPLGAMKLAIAEARKGFGFVSPNPPVGCVILDRDGNFLAKGYHRKFGSDHAEIDALKQIQNEKALEGATVYVTLEPCAHFGKTPPCAVALAKLPVAKVVYGLKDPNLLVSGQGLEILKRAKISVQPVGELVGDAATELIGELEDLAEVFLLNHREKKSFVSVKIATTLDGQIAHVSGESKWLTGDNSREHAQYLRGIHDAVMIGAGTFRQDNPKLNVRHSRFSGKSNYAIIVNSKGDLLDQIADSELLNCHEPGRVIVAVGESSKNLRRFERKSEILNKVQIWPLPEKNGLIKLSALFEKAFDTGLSSIFVEGGARLVSNLIVEGHVHRLYQFVAPQLLGAKSGKPFTEGLDIPKFSDRIIVERPAWLPLGDDVLLTGRL